MDAHSRSTFNKQRAVCYSHAGSMKKKNWERESEEIKAIIKEVIYSTMLNNQESHSLDE